MRRIHSLRSSIAVGVLSVGCVAALPLLAQPDVRVLAGDVTDARFSGGHRTGGLSLKVKVRGDGMDGVQALRFLLADARDDLGNELLPMKREAPEFHDVRGDGAEQQLSFRNPPRDASSFRVSGEVELFVPARDPNAVVKVSRAFARPGRPLSSPGLAAANVELTLLPRAEQAPEVVSLRGRTADFDRLRSIRILRADGSEIRVSSRGRVSDGVEAVTTLETVEPVPKDASLLFTILTAKALLPVTFDLKEIPLP
jgi:hypothetical protein